MKNLILLLLVTIICSAYPLRAQTAPTAPPYIIGLGGIFRTDSIPHAGGSFSFRKTLTDNGKTRLIAPLMEFRAIQKGVISHDVRFGVEQVLYSDQNVELSACAMDGIATSPNATGNLFAGCGTIALYHKKHFRFALTGEALTSPLLNGWEPQVRGEIQYVFGGQ